VQWVDDEDAQDRYKALSKQSKRRWLQTLEHAATLPHLEPSLLRCADTREAVLIGAEILRQLRMTRSGL
jgi:hypothetical protein